MGGGTDPFQRAVLQDGTAVCRTINGKIIVRMEGAVFPDLLGNS